MTALETVADAAVARNQANEALIKELVEALEFSRGSIFENNHFKDVAEVIDAALAKAEARHAL